MLFYDGCNILFFSFSSELSMCEIKDKEIEGISEE